MPTIEKVSIAQAGAASQIAIASTVPTPSGGWTVGSYVGAATTDASGMMKVIAWSIGEPSAGLVRVGDATWTNSTKNVAIAGLDPNRFVTAHVDNTGSLNVGLWAVGALEFPGGGGPPADPLVWLQYGTSGLSATEVAIATMSSNQVVTAVRDSSGNLRVDAWVISGGLTAPGDSVGILSPSGSVVAGPATNVAIAAASSDQAVAAFRNASGSDSGKLGLIAFKVSGGKVTRESSIDAGVVGQVAITNGGPGGSSVSTATTDDKGVLEFVLRTVSSSGAIAKLESATASAASQLGLCSTQAGSDKLAIAATFGSSGNLEMQVWDKDSFGGVYTQSTSIPTTAVSAAVQGYDNEGRGYFVTATRGVKPDDLGVQVWSVVAAAAPPSQLGSFANYIFGNNDCTILKDIRVTIEITEDLVVDSTVTNKGKPTTKGCAFQLNANSSAQPKNANPANWIVWQQYILGVGTVIEGAINNWTAPALKSNIQTINSPAVQIGEPLAEAAKIPAGYKLTFILTNDQAGNITIVTFEVYDPKTKKTTSSPPQVLTQLGATPAEVAPIVDLELNLVGPGDTDKTQFSSGKGTITYSASTSFSALPAIPGCAGSNTTTGETSNSVYGVVSAGAHLTFVQTFSV